MENRHKQMDRRAFVALTATATAAGLVLTLAGCSDDKGTNGTGNGRTGLVDTAETHSHTLKITQAQLDAGVGVTLLLEGSGHTHELVLSDADVKSLKAGGQIHGRESSRNGSPEHLHTTHFM